MTERTHIQSLLINAQKAHNPDYLPEYEIHKNIRNFLLGCREELGGDGLASILANDPYVSTWQHNIQTYGSMGEKVSGLIAELYKRWHAIQKANGLVLFLLALENEIELDDDRSGVATVLAVQFDNALRNAGKHYY